MTNSFICLVPLQEERDCTWKCCSFSFFKVLNIKPLIHALAAVPTKCFSLTEQHLLEHPGTGAAPVSGQAKPCPGADVLVGDQRNSWGVRKGWHEGWTPVLLESLSGRWCTYTVIFGLCQTSIFSLSSGSGSKNISTWYWQLLAECLAAGFLCKWDLEELWKEPNCSHWQVMVSEALQGCVFVYRWLFL